MPRLSRFDPSSHSWCGYTSCSKYLSSAYDCHDIDLVLADAWEFPIQNWADGRGDL